MNAFLVTNWAITPERVFFLFVTLFIQLHFHYKQQNNNLMLIMVRTDFGIVSSPRAFKCCFPSPRAFPAHLRHIPQSPAGWFIRRIFPILWRGWFIRSSGPHSPPLSPSLADFPAYKSVRLCPFRPSFPSHSFIRPFLLIWLPIFSPSPHPLQMFFSRSICPLSLSLSLFISHCLFSHSFAQLFLPSSHLPSLLSSSSPKRSSSNDCACSSSSSKFHRQSLASTENFRHKMLEQQMDEAKKVKALVNMLNVRRKPIKSVTKLEGMPSEMVAANLELMMKTNELQKMRGQGQWKGDKKERKKDKKEEKEKQKKKKAKMGQDEAEMRRAKRKSDHDPWGEEGGGNSVLEEPLTPPDNERDGTTKGRCNSERIRRIIKRAKGRDASAIKRNIQTVAERQYEAKFNVICANADFSYISNTDEFCQEQINGNTCYVFRQLERNRKFIAEGEDEEGEDDDDGGGEEEEQFAQQIAALGKGRKRKRN